MPRRTSASLHALPLQSIPSGTAAMDLCSSSGGQPVQPRRYGCPQSAADPGQIVSPTFLKESPGVASHPHDLPQHLGVDMFALPLRALVQETLSPGTCQARSGQSAFPPSPESSPPIRRNRSRWVPRRPGPYRKGSSCREHGKSARLGSLAHAADERVFAHDADRREADLNSRLAIMARGRPADTCRSCPPC